MKSLVDVYSQYISSFKPTHVIFNDPITMKITEDHPDRDNFKRVNIIHTAEQLPFGPFVAGVDGHCLSPKVEDALLRGLDGIWSVSKAVKEYAWTHGKLDTTFLVHPPSTYLDKESGAMPVVRNNIDKDEIGMVNPCPHKGLSILVALAKKFPDMKFVTWKSWGSRTVHIDQLLALPNVKWVPTPIPGPLQRSPEHANLLFPPGSSPPPRTWTKSGTASRSSWLPRCGMRPGALS